MAFIDWSDEIAIGVEAVDDEHRELINAINDLAAALGADEDRSRTI